jgi:hypothetical protein
MLGALKQKKIPKVKKEKFLKLKQEKPVASRL